MKRIDRLHYVKSSIENFKIPESDSLHSCLIASTNNDAINWRSAIYISMKSEPLFYANIFEFWVRSFFCFTEDFGLGEIMLDNKSNLVCYSYSKKNFEKMYFQVLRSGMPDEYFLDGQKFSESYVEMDSRTFSDAYEMLNTPLLKSYVATSNGGYVSFFQLLTDSVDLTLH